jgi:rhodanese-related sulfurtransferase
MVGTPEVQNIPADAVLAAQQAGEALIVDVREPAEFAVERIAGALNLPLSTFDPASLLAVVDPARVIFQCGSGMRSMKAVVACRLSGLPADRHLAGGIGAWKAAGLPVIRIDPATGQPA